jgi:hypothetical protein
VRLIDRLYFGAGLHRMRGRRQLRPPTRRDLMYARYGPSRWLVVFVLLSWLLVLVLVVNLAVLALRGLDIY